MKITSIDRNAIRTINQAIEDAIKSVADEFGVVITFGSSRFTHENYSTKMEVAVVTKSGNAMTAEAKAWNLYAELEGLDKDFLFKTVMWKGNPMQIIGYKPRSSKYPVLGICEGKTYKYPVEAVKRAIIAQKILDEEKADAVP